MDSTDGLSDATAKRLVIGGSVAGVLIFATGFAIWLLMVTAQKPENTAVAVQDQRAAFQATALAYLDEAIATAKEVEKGSAVLAIGRQHQRAIEAFARIENAPPEGWPIQNQIVDLNTNLEALVKMAANNAEISLLDKAAGRKFTQDAIRGSIALRTVAVQLKTIVVLPKNAN